MAATGVWLPQGAGPAGCTPHFLFPLVEKKTGRARSKRKDRLDALRRIRASALYGGRREMVPACLRGPADRRGGVRYRLDGGFPRRGCVLGWGAKPHLTSSSFRAFRFATRCLGGCGGLCWRADEGVRPYTELEAFVTLARADTQVGPYKMHKADGISVGADAFIGSRAGQPAAAKREAIPCDNHPDPLRTIRHGTAVSTSQKAQACPKARKNRSRHWYADPRTRGGPLHRSASKRLSLWTVHGPFLFWQDKREMGGASPLDKPSGGSQHPRGRRCGGPYRSRQTSSSSDRS